MVTRCQTVRGESEHGRAELRNRLRQCKELHGELHRLVEEMRAQLHRLSEGPRESEESSPAPQDR